MEKTRITWTLLEKPADELTDAERDAVNAYLTESRRRMDHLESENSKIVSDCKMLFSGIEHVPIPDYGWIHPVERLCYALEGLNYEYKKYRMKIVVDQTKEKYGTLRFYTSILIGNTGFFGRLHDLVSRLTDRMSEVNYCYNFIQEAPEYKTLEWREITKDDFEKLGGSEGYTPVVIKSKDEIKELPSCEHTKYFIEENGKYFRSYLLLHPRKGHVVPTRHKTLFRLRNALLKVENGLARLMSERPTVQVVKNIELQNKVDELVRRAERECSDVCMRCGIPFSEHTPMCETLGWYTYVCEDCACSHGSRYRKNDKIYQEGVEIDEEREVHVKEDGTAE